MLPFVALHRASRPLLLAMAVATLAGCQSPPPDEQEAATAQAQQEAVADAAPSPENAPQPPPIGSCDASQLQGLVGQPLTDALSAQAQLDANARQVRVLKPGQMVTMEFNGERLNLEVDDKQHVTAVRCG